MFGPHACLHPTCVQCEQSAEGASEAMQLQLSWECLAPGEQQILFTSKPASPPCDLISNNTNYCLSLFPSFFFYFKITPGPQGSPGLTQGNLGLTQGNLGLSLGSARL